MNEEIIFSGFGGQGAFSPANCWPIQRWRAACTLPGSRRTARRCAGDRHCTVVVSDEPIGSPFVRRPHAVIALNLPSFEKYEPLIKSGGLMVYNESLVPLQPTRTDITYIAVPANDVAEQLGNVRMANVVLGNLVATGYLTLETVETALDLHLGQRQRKYLGANKQALHQGAEFARQVCETVAA